MCCAATTRASAFSSTLSGAKLGRSSGTPHASTYRYRSTALLLYCSTALPLSWRTCRSSISNYLAALIQCILFALTTSDDAQTGSYDQVSNLRRQAEKMAAVDQLYKRKDANWIDWQEVQQTRVKICNAYNEASAAGKRELIRDVIIVLLHSITPPDRVGVIRRLRCGLSLRVEEDLFVIDTTKQRHKT